MAKKEQIKKILKIIFYIAVLISICFPFAFHLEIEGYFIPYNYTVYGTYVEINEYTGGECDVEIPAFIWFRPVKVIDNHAFEEVYYLTSVKIPDTVTSLGAAFPYCIKLENVTIGKNIKKLENGTFKGCWNLKEIIIPENVESLTGNPFNSCESLKSVVFCNPFVEIDEDAFRYCNFDILTLKSKEGSTVEQYAKEHSTGWESMEKLPETETKNNVAIVGIVLLGISAICLTFIYKRKHRKITVADIKEMIKPRRIIESTISCLKKNKIKIIIMLAGIYIFVLYIVPMGSPIRMKGIFVPYEYTIHASYIEIDRYTGEKSEVRIPGWLWLKPVRKIGSIYEKNGVFQNLDYITKVKMPNTVTELIAYDFMGCSNLEEISLSRNLSVIGKGSFWGCRKLKEIVIPYKVKEIGEDAFIYCESLESITLQNPHTEFYVGTFLYDANDDGKLEVNPNMIIKAEKNSTGYKFAKEYEIKWEENVYVPFPW